MKRFLYLSAAALAGAALLAWLLLPNPKPVEAAPVTQGRFERSVLEDGRTRLQARYTLSAPQTGELGRITLQVGDRVSQGQVVAELRPPRAPLLDARSRSEQLERIAAAQANLARAQAQRDRAAAAQTLAQSALARSESLSQQGFVSPAQNESARTELRLREQELVAARQDEAAAAHGLAQARATLLAEAGSAPTTAGRYTVRSPVNGQVLKVLQTSEGTVATGTPLLEIGDPQALDVVADLLTDEAAELRPGTPARLTNWGGSEPLQGQVLRVEPTAYTKVSSLGVEEQRVRVVIALLTPPERRPSLGDGYKVDVALRVQQVDNAITVPVGALFPLGGRSAVYALIDGRARLREVIVGARNGSQAWIQSGLSAGMTVLLYPDAQLRDGDAVRTR